MILLSLYYYFTAIGILNSPHCAINRKLEAQYVGAICGFQRVSYTKVVSRKAKWEVGDCNSDFVLSLFQSFGSKRTAALPDPNSAITRAATGANRSSICPTLET